MTELGKLLHDTREQKGLTLKDVESVLNIRTVYLDAIEQGNYDVVPGEVYLKGFIRNYANFLGLDAKQILDMYHQSQQSEVPVPEQLPEKPSPKEEFHAKTPHAVSKEGHTLPIKSLTIGACVVAAVAVGGWLMMSHHPSTPPEHVEQPTGQYSTNANPVPAGQPQNVVQPQSATPSSLNLTAVFKDECWVKVVADGKTIFSESVPKGTTKTWQGQKSLQITLGNAGAADLSLNGNHLGMQGKTGEVVEKTFTESTVNKAQ